MEKSTFSNMFFTLSSESDEYEYMESPRCLNKSVCPRSVFIRDRYYLKPSRGVSRVTTGREVPCQIAAECASVWTAVSTSP